MSKYWEKRREKEIRYIEDEIMARKFIEDQELKDKKEFKKWKKKKLQN